MSSAQRQPVLLGSHEAGTPWSPGHRAWPVRGEEARRSLEAHSGWLSAADLHRSPSRTTPGSRQWENRTLVRSGLGSQRSPNWIGPRFLGRPNLRQVPAAIPLWRASRLLDCRPKQAATFRPKNHLRAESAQRPVATRDYRIRPATSPSQYGVPGGRCTRTAHLQYSRL